jgi:sRNA-binding carbon storage regulator CsrA
MLIGDDIEISIVHIGSTRVRIGIRAPQHYRVVPGEKRQVAGGARSASELAPDSAPSAARHDNR